MGTTGGHNPAARNSSISAKAFFDRSDSARTRRCREQTSAGLVHRTTSNAPDDGPCSRTVSFGRRPYFRCEFGEVLVSRLKRVALFDLCPDRNLQQRRCGQVTAFSWRYKSSGR